MEKDKRPPETSDGHDKHDHTDESGGPSRRQFLGTAGVAAGALAAGGLMGAAFAAPATPPGQGQPAVPPGQAKPVNRLVLKNAIVLTMDGPQNDFENADVVIEGSKIASIGSNSGAGGQVIDCTGMIVMPGFVDTHHHQYETIQRNIIPDGNLQWAGMGPQWPEEGYGTIVQSVWTTGRIGPADDPTWELGRSPYDPEDCYISELVADWAAINGGVTTGIDTSQSSHSAEHTDAMIQGLMDSGRRSLFAYGGGRSDTPGFEFPGAIGNTTSGIGRLRTQFFSSDDQLVTLGYTGGPTAGWELARAFDAVIINHNNSSGANLITPAAIALLEQFANEEFHVEQIHCARFTEAAYDACKQYGVHISIAGPIEKLMGHGMPPYQACLRRGILPSLSADVDTTMTPDMFTLMRTAITTQRAILHQRALPGIDATNTGKGETPIGTPAFPPIGADEVLLNSYQVLQMATWAGAVAAGNGHKTGKLRVGWEADIIVLNAKAINTWPLNNAPGAIVTMMDTSNVDTVIIGGVIKKQAGKLVGVNLEKLLNDVEASRDRVLGRIRGPATGTNPAIINQFINSQHNGIYRPALLGSCCNNEPVMHVGTYNASPGTGA
jgi:hypothetical protein